MALAVFGVLSSGCGGASREQQAEQASLRHRIAELEQKVAALSMRDRAGTDKPALTVTGAVQDTDGKPASGAVVAVVAGDFMSEGQTDAAGHFSVDVPVGGDAFIYAYKNGRSARLQAAVDTAKTISLSLVEAGAIEGTFSTPGTPGKVFGWTAPGHVSAVLPGLWGTPAAVTGDRFRFEGVPAGDVEIHLAVGEGPTSSTAHALVRVEPGTTTTVKLEPAAATSSVTGTVESGATREPLRSEAFLLMPDGSPEAWYPVTGHFGFVGRTPGDRVLLFVARGYRPKRVPVTLEANREMPLGDVLLEPIASNASPAR
jgi:hypothetical protein